MYFTREPIIETVITPRDGCKLVVRSSKSAGQEEYFVDAIEVVSFDSALFYRSLERPKSFLVPVSDYEVVEVRETRVVLRHATAEKTIKIGGGKEAPKEQPKKEEEAKVARKRERRKRGRRRRDDVDEAADTDEAQEGEEVGVQGEAKGAAPAEPRVIPQALTSVIPPPKTLISDSIQRYKDMMTQAEDSNKEAPPEDKSKSEPVEDKEVKSDVESEAAKPEAAAQEGALGAFSPGHLLRRFRSRDGEDRPSEEQQ